MKRLIYPIAILLAFTTTALMCSCDQNKDAEPSITSEAPDAAIPTDKTEETIEFTMFSTMFSTEFRADDNEIKDIIAEKTGVRVNEAWVNGTMDTTDLVEQMCSNPQGLPDFFYAEANAHKFYEYGAAVAWDPYLDKYPDIKALHTDEEWDLYRQEDGHIYWADFMNCCYQKDTTAFYEGEAFWIQTRVLEWADYPKIETLDDYLDLLDRYAEANPEMPDGTSVIPYCCLDYNVDIPPVYLEGYPNNGCAIVNADDQVVDYNISDTAKRYFKRLNEEYKKGKFVLDHNNEIDDKYVDKLESGRVLGFFDEYYINERMFTRKAFDKTRRTEDGSEYTLSELGCDYVPLGLVMEHGTKQQYYTYNYTDPDAGLAVTTACKDPDRAFGFINDLLSREMQDLRFWGIKDTDYLVDDNGLYYRTDEMRVKWQDEDCLHRHVCEYSCLPHWRGMSRDGINCVMPEEQLSEFRAVVPESVVKCLDSYGAENYVDFLGSDQCDPYPWFWIRKWVYELPDDSSAGNTWNKIRICKIEHIPNVVTADDFDSAWEEYMTAYHECNPEYFIDAVQAEVEARSAGN